LQGESFHAVLRLDLTLSGQTESHVLEVWTLGEDYALIRILPPNPDAGTGYLKVKDDLWYYSPDVGMAIELPAIALGDALLGQGRRSATYPAAPSLTITMPPPWLMGMATYSL